MSPEGIFSRSSMGMVIIFSCSLLLIFFDVSSESLFISFPLWAVVTYQTAMRNIMAVATSMAPYMSTRLCAPPVLMMFCRKSPQK